MKAVILAGGLGTRFSEETHLRPKPMIEIGGMPILWHIMKVYSCHGITDFVICCGYKGYIIKEYFHNYYMHQCDVTLNIAENTASILQSKAEKWNVTLVDTGENTMTGGRLARVRPYLNRNEPFCFTYGDGVGNVDISRAISFHEGHGRAATVTACRPPARFGALKMTSNNLVENFEEKPIGDGNWVNGGFFVLSDRVFDYIKGDSDAWEEGPLKGIASDKELYAFKHEGFWQPMDTLRDKNLLSSLWDSGKAPWKSW